MNTFFDQNGEEGDPRSRFEMVSARVLRIEVDGSVWTNMGAAVAHYGDLRFERLPTFKTEHLGKMFLREVAPLVRAVGRGRLYCAHSGWHLRTVYLSDETIHVSAAELLAFEDSLEFEMYLVRGGLSITSGGLIAMRLSGSGSLAIAVHGDPLVLPVTNGNPLKTDPHATVAWTAELTPTLNIDLNWRSFVGHGGGEAFQMNFEGEGHVVVQPSEDPVRFTGKNLKRLFSGRKQ